MAYTKLIPQHTSGASVEEIVPGEAYRLSIPAGPSDKYRLAQLYDYAQTQRNQFSLRAPLRLSLSARTSSESIPGTWGFGLWNDPFGMSFGFGGNPWRMPALPNAAWFFGASEENYLSFRDPRAERETANGFLAQVFRSPKFHPLLFPAGLALPFSRKATRRLLGQVIGEEGIALRVDATEWHRYSLEWREERVTFEVDNVQVLESHVIPNPPLGTIIWIDNQYAAFTPEGKIGFGVLANPEPAWLEIKDIDIR